MKAISIQMPWAWLIVLGWKPVENRSWYSAYRGPLLIHAGKSFDYSALDWLHEQGSHEFDHILAVVNEHFSIRYRTNPSTGSQKGIGCDSNELGGIIGSVNMIDCVQQFKSPWFFGPHGFVFEDAKSLPFQPMRGQLGLFNVDAPPSAKEAGQGKRGGVRG